MDRTDPGEHARHKAILGDFDRLARLDGLSFVGADVDVRGDDALARFRVSGNSRDSRPARSRGLAAAPAEGWAIDRVRECRHARKERRRGYSA